MYIIQKIKELCQQYHIDWKFIKFLFVGGINTAFSYSVYALCIFLKFHFTVASLISTVLGVLFNFKTTGTIVFKNSDNKLIFKFISVYVVTYFANICGLKIFDIFHFNMYYAGLIMVFPIAVLSFVLMKKFVFVNKK